MVARRAETRVRLIFEFVGLPPLVLNIVALKPMKSMCFKSFSELEIEIGDKVKIYCNFCKRLGCELFLRSN